MATTPTAILGRRSATTETKVPAAWQVATVRQIIQETPETKTFWLDLDQRLPIVAGQHLEVRLTAADGYQAARSYSIASSPLEPGLAITVQMIPGGEVSGYLDSKVKVGQSLEIHYPIGYHFIWSESITDPILLIAGGTGVVPLAAMLRQHQLSGVTTPMRLLYSARNLEVVLYKDWLLDSEFAQSGRTVELTLTNEAPADWHGYRRRIDVQIIREVASGLDLAELRAYICGPTPMVEAVSQTLVNEVGMDPRRIKTERFGPTGQTS